MQKRTFESGASRNSDINKLEYTGFLDPKVIKRYAEYMHKNTILEDGSKRSASDWKKGIPEDVYMSSLFRHFMKIWEKSSDKNKNKEEYLDDLCALLFNAMGIIFENLKEEK